MVDLGLVFEDGDGPSRYLQPFVQFFFFGCHDPVFGRKMIILFFECVSERYFKVGLVLFLREFPKSNVFSPIGVCLVREF